MNDLPLRQESPAAWAVYVSAHMDEFLLDHASCERKAAALCMSFITKYPDRGALVEPMTALAREELAHFLEVYRIAEKRRLCLAPQDERDTYVNGILQHLRHGRDERFLDRLIMSGLIEARGCERFSLLAETLEDVELKNFYHRLSQSERGHYKVFFRLAAHHFHNNAVEEAVNRLSLVESESMLASAITARLH